MITVKYPDGRIEHRLFATISGQPPIGSKRPLLDDSVITIMEGCIEVASWKESDEDSTIIWPWDRITELDLGPVVQENVTLMESDDVIPF